MASEPLAIANPGLHRQESGLDIAKIASAYDTRPQESGTKDGSELSEENPWEKKYPRCGVPFREPWVLS